MTLPLPNPALRAGVVVPARDEEGLIESCLQALATQTGVAPHEYEVLLVLDRCTDETEERARKIGALHPSLRLHFLDGPGEGSSPARQVGMDAKRARLLQVGSPEGPVACMDADTLVALDWLAAQLRAVSQGARAIGGRIELAEEGSLPEGVWRRHAEEGRLRHGRLLSDPAGQTQHWQFSGASLALGAAMSRGRWLPSKTNISKGYCVIMTSRSSACSRLGSPPRPAWSTAPAAASPTTSPK